MGVHKSIRIAIVGSQPGEIVSPGHVVKAMILNGLGERISAIILIFKFF